MCSELVGWTNWHLAASIQQFRVAIRAVLA